MLAISNILQTSWEKPVESLAIHVSYSSMESRFFHADCPLSAYDRIGYFVIMRQISLRWMTCSRIYFGLRTRMEEPRLETRAISDKPAANADNEHKPIPAEARVDIHAAMLCSLARTIRV